MDMGNAKKYTPKIRRYSISVAIILTILPNTSLSQSLQSEFNSLPIDVLSKYFKIGEREIISCKTRVLSCSKYLIFYPKDYYITTRSADSMSSMAFWQSNSANTLVILDRDGIYPTFMVKSNAKWIDITDREILKIRRVFSKYSATGNNIELPRKGTNITFYDQTTVALRGYYSNGLYYKLPISKSALDLKKSELCSIYACQITQIKEDTYNVTVTNNKIYLNAHYSPNEKSYTLNIYHKDIEDINYKQVIQNFLRTINSEVTVDRLFNQCIKVRTPIGYCFNVASDKDFSIKIIN